MWKNTKGHKLPTPRDAVYLFGYALKIADFEVARKQKDFSLCGVRHYGQVNRAHLEKAFHELIAFGPMLKPEIKKSNVRLDAAQRYYLNLIYQGQSRIRPSGRARHSSFCRYRPPRSWTGC